MRETPVNDSDPDIKTLGTRVVYENPWMRVREDAIRRRDGSQGIYGVVEKPNAVVVVPIHVDGSLHLVQQYRYPVRGRYWELPQGALEQAPNADPLDIARAELREETGLDASEWLGVESLFQSYGYTTLTVHVFVARGLIQLHAQREPEEQDLIARAIPYAAVLRMIGNEIKDATTVAAIGLLRLRGLL